MIRNEKSEGVFGGDKKYKKNLAHTIANKLKKFDHFTISIEVEELESLTGQCVTKKENFLRVDDFQICNSPK